MLLWNKFRCYTIHRITLLLSDLRSITAVSQESFWVLYGIPIHCHCCSRGSFTLVGLSAIDYLRRPRRSEQFRNRCPVVAVVRVTFIQLLVRVLEIDSRWRAGLVCRHPSLSVLHNTRQKSIQHSEMSECWMNRSGNIIDLIQLSNMLKGCITLRRNQ